MFQIMTDIVIYDTQVVAGLELVQALKYDEDWFLEEAVGISQVRDAEQTAKKIVEHTRTRSY